MLVAYMPGRAFMITAAKSDAAIQEWWNEAAQVHARGDGYQVKEFKDSNHTLNEMMLHSEAGGRAARGYL